MKAVLPEPDGWAPVLVGPNRWVREVGRSPGRGGRRHGERPACRGRAGGAVGDARGLCGV